MLTRRRLFGFLAAAPVAAVAKPLASGGVVAASDLPRVGEPTFHIEGSYSIPPQFAQLFAETIKGHCVVIERSLPPMMAKAQSRHGA